MVRPTLIHLNGAPGVGKLTIGRSLARSLGARLLDNHAIHDVAFALTEFRSAEFYETVRAVRTVAYDRVLRLPASIPVILTDAFFDDSSWGRESWADLLDLAAARAARLFTIALTCEPEEHCRRIAGDDRAAKGKTRDTAYVETVTKRRLLERQSEDSLRLDVTRLAADEAASAIATWLSEC